MYHVHENLRVTPAWSVDLLVDASLRISDHAAAERRFGLRDLAVEEQRHLSSQMKSMGLCGGKSI